MSKLGDRAKELAKKAKELGQEAAELGKEAIQQGKESVYKTAAKIEHDVHHRTGVAGSIADVVEGTANTVKQVHEDVQSKGGYLQVAGDAIDSIVDRMTKSYDSMQQKFGTGGYFDETKFKAYVKTQADAIKLYGKKAGTELWDLSKQTGANVKDTVKKDFRTHFPSPEERKTKYAGIGSAYNWPLMRQDYENCLTFHDKASDLLKGVKGKTQILTDIKATAAANSDELVTHYIEHGIDSTKIALVKKYLD